MQDFSFIFKSETRKVEKEIDEHLLETKKNPMEN